MKCQRCDYHEKLNKKLLAEVDKYKEHILDLSIKLARALDEVDYWEGFWK